MSAECPARVRRVPVAAGIALHLLEWGARDGFPVLILHGGGQSAACWAEVCAHMPRELRCLVPDQRGHGESDWAPDGDYACEAQVADLVCLLDALEVVRCAVVGHSMGGLNALRLAGTHAERVAAVVLVDVGTETRERGLQRTQRRGRAPSGPFSRAQALELLRRRYPRHDAAWLERQLARELRQTPAGLWESRTDPRFLGFVSTYCGDAAERRRLLRASGPAPLLVIRGEHSRILTSESAATTARLGSGRVVEISGAGHSLPLDSPHELAEALSRFLLDDVV